MIAQILENAADDCERGSGRLSPPAYVWVEAGFSCIGFDLVGEVSYAAGSRVVQQRYRVSYQVRRAGSTTLGQIEYCPVAGGWLIRSVGQFALPPGESLVYLTWEAAQGYLWTHYQETKRQAVAALAAE